MDWGGPIESFIVHIAASIQQQFDHLVVIAVIERWWLVGIILHYGIILLTIGQQCAVQ